MKRLFPKDYALRHELNDELHIHPYEPLIPPERVLYLAVLVTAQERGEEDAHLDALARHFGGATPTPGANQVRYRLGDIRLKVERHQEFTRYKFVYHDTKAADASPFATSLRELLPPEWLTCIPGRTLTALDITVLPYGEGNTLEKTVDRYAGEFKSASFTASQFGRSKGLALTDFVIREDGLMRILVLTRARQPAQNGRLLLRIIEMETYRMLALMALPDARNLLHQLPVADQKLTHLTQAIAQGNGVNDEALLEKLTELAADVEQLVAANYRRLSASHAYFDLVFKRLDDLREETVENVPSFGGVLGRRLEPARNTCESVSRWLDQLSQRVANASDLLRTRIDVRHGRQNQELLSAMNKRFQLQLRLQQAAEILSVAIFTYYSVNLVAYVVEELEVLMGLEANPLLIKATAAPLLAATALYILFRKRKKKLSE
ncbi:MAG: DUF3422 domain-containing protein [Zetaproteobacteria bacterium CG12_big_fil_rev_8_21_14_0_65_54_13]|nr:MAG: DUF3422 domain-containing protein [Zetaproteobacteria bacterium CG12_big_fil_rev_8_21_14_0_65_54_13]PIX54304.1 MAG: DUF3422 domain-containing protein [Zetaproteobacteria bacterium CG_4_10_14_3_um_filter_54_28]PJA28001.1 MAG: DUF3422 domain-containing protein [Zetaproteobacteria bacterium CG_4_9_14_3_um_filter_54_145]